MKSAKDWQQWARTPETESRYHEERLKGKLSTMESTKQLSNLISDIHKPGMKVLDVGCNVGHYLMGLRKKFPDLDYVGADAYKYYIDIANEHFANDLHAKFVVKSILKPIFPENPFDIVYCCNVIQHLPDFRKPISNLLASTKKVCFIRMMIGDHTTIVKFPVADDYDKEGNPEKFWYMNTWKKEDVTKFIKKLGWKVSYIDDKYKPSKIQYEFDKVKTDKVDKGTRILDGRQVINNIILNWIWLKITKK